MNALLRQIKARRQVLGLKQNDMPLRIGVSRQQYQRLEAKGNPRLNTLELIAKGLNCEIMLIPSEKLTAVLAVLHSDAAKHSANTLHTRGESLTEDSSATADDPWRGLLGDET